MKREVISLFPYVGGKSVLAMNLVEIVDYAYSRHPYISTFVDACGGGGRLILNLPRRGRQIYSELDPSLSNLFWAVADMGRVIELIRRLEKIPVNEKTYKKMTQRYKRWATLPIADREPIPDPIVSAVYAYYLTHL
jgi:site-specific DNA-adenine methylase